MLRYEQWPSAGSVCGLMSGWRWILSHDDTVSVDDAGSLNALLAFAQSLWVTFGQMGKYGLGVIWEERERSARSSRVRVGNGVTGHRPWSSPFVRAGATSVGPRAQRGQIRRDVGRS